MATPSARGLHSEVLEPPAGSPCAIDVLCVCVREWFRVCLGKGWPAPCPEQGMGGRDEVPTVASLPYLPLLGVTPQPPPVLPVGHVGRSLRGGAADSSWSLLLR